MGNKPFKCKKQEDMIIAADEKITQRENMATWHRTDIALTDVYEIMNTLGQGHMGEVYKVRRKVENRGLHNAETRGKAAATTDTQIDNVPEELLNNSGQDAALRNISMDISERSGGSFGSKSLSRRQKKNRQKMNDETLKKAQEEEKRMAMAEEEEASSFTSPPVSPRPPPKSILKNPMEVDPGRMQELKSLSQQFNDADIDNDEDIPPLGLAKTTSSVEDKDDDLDQDSEGSPQDPDPNSKKKGFRHKDSSLLLHPHFSALTDCFQPSSESEMEDNSHTEALITGDSGSEHDSDHPDDTHVKEKKGRWVPRRKIRFQRLYACKTIGTEKIDQSQIQELLNEIYMMRKMDHPYIIRLYEVYQVKSKFDLT
jgi:serine/threonine protein kinase